MSRTQTQHSRVCALQNCDRHSQPRNVNAAQNVTLLDGWLKRAYFGPCCHPDLGFQGVFCGDLVEPCIEQGETNVSERYDTSNKQEAAAPTNQALGPRRETQGPFNSEFHG